MSNATPQMIDRVAEMRRLATAWRQSGKTIGVVPTMGALHDGHLSLVRSSLERSDVTVVTIFVNPTQFAQGEDLGTYPRPFEEDCQKLAELGVEYLFAPGEDEMYPQGYSTKVLPGKMSKTLEGEFRPTHFGGVVTVVLKLFHIVQADLAFFGEKDFQQVAVIEQMVRDLNVPIEIVSCPIVREEDGLAMSSRNIYLSTEEREAALSLHRTLDWCEEEILEGERDTHMLMATMRQMLIDGGVTSIDYAVVADPAKLDVHPVVELPSVALVAARVGATRLIDNRVIRG